MAHRNQMKKWKLGKAQEMRRNPTPAECALWVILRRERLGVKFRRQAPCLGYILDFYCPSLKVVIEVDGGYHIKRIDADIKRDSVLLQNGFRTVRFTNDQVLNDPAYVESVILDFVKIQTTVRSL
jgi:leucyl-tRNA synthetase